MSKSPGRELDAEVAEKVMGIVWCKCSKWHGAWETYTVGDEYCKCDECGDSVPYPMKYSTDISAAWEVVEKLQRIEFQGEERDFQLHFQEEFNGWRDETEEARFNKPHWKAGWHVLEDELEPFARGFTAPHAICLAALKAVGYEEKKQN